MTTLYVTEPRSTVKKDGDTLLVDIPGNRDQGTQRRKVRIPLRKVTQVVIQGHSTLTTPAIVALMEQNSDVCFLSYYGQFRGRLLPGESKNGLLRLAQHRAHADPDAAMTLAQRFVQGKLHNMRTLLLRSNRKLEDPVVAQATEEMAQIIQDVVALENDVAVVGPDPSRPLSQSTWGTLLGYEGAASLLYFSVFGRLFSDDWGFSGRKKRPPTDPTNALLSYGYTLLLNHVASACQIVGFDPFIGYLHSTQYGKPALALDLMEEFRTPVIDSVVLTVLNNGMLRPTDFEDKLGACYLSDSGRKTFLQKFEDRMQTEIKHPTFGYKASYRKCLELQARLVGKWLLNEIPDYPPLMTR
jgi:CRISPR-associated protein Cas1